MSVGEKLTSAAYIEHHLYHWRTPAAHFNLDTLLVSIIIGLLFLAFFHLVARKAHAGLPGPVQNFVEAIIEFVDNTVKDVFHGKSDLIGPLSLSIFMWVFLMSFMDLIPVDLLPRAVGYFGVSYFRAVPTADLNQTFALSLAVFFFFFCIS